MSSCVDSKNLDVATVIRIALKPCILASIIHRYSQLAKIICLTFELEFGVLQNATILKSYSVTACETNIWELILLFMLNICQVSRFLLVT